MADKLPLIKQCMADIQAGAYEPSDPAKVVAGAELPVVDDPTEDEPVTIIIDPTKPLITDSTVIHVPTDGTAEAQAATIAVTTALDNAAIPVEAVAEATSETKDDTPADGDKKDDGKKDDDKEKKDEKVEA